MMQKVKKLIKKFPFFENFYRRYLIKKLKDEINLEFPSEIVIEPTNACDLKCSFCARNISSKKVGFMDFELFKKIIDESVLYGMRERIHLLKDGESLLHPKIFDMIRYIKERGAAKSVHINTNAVSLNEDKAKKLILSGVDDILISIDAAMPETYKKIKGGDFLRIVENNIRTLVQIRNKTGRKKPFITVKMIEMSSNINEKDRFLKKWKGIADDVIFQKMHTWNGLFEDKKTKEYMEKESVGESVAKRFPCHYLWRYMTINWDGRVSLCCVDYNCKGIIGNIKNNSLHEIWKSTNLRKVRLLHLQGKTDKIPICNNCVYWSYNKNFKEVINYLNKHKIY